jgi:hypothetical protein
VEDTTPSLVVPMRVSVPFNALMKISALIYDEDTRDCADENRV